eukprot:1498159-Rhodomonas_salina.1
MDMCAGVPKSQCAFKHSNEPEGGPHLHHVQPQLPAAVRTGNHRGLYLRSFKKTSLNVMCMCMCVCHSGQSAIRVGMVCGHSVHHVGLEIVGAPVLLRDRAGPFLACSVVLPLCSQRSISLLE